MPATPDIIRILSIGTIGLGFLLAFLAFTLLRKEQSIDSPRPQMLGSISRYMIFSFALCMIGLSSEWFHTYLPPTHKATDMQPPVAGLFPVHPDEQPSAIKAIDALLGKLDAQQFRDAYDNDLPVIKKNETYIDFENQAAFTEKTFGKRKSRMVFLAQQNLGFTINDRYEPFYTFYYISSFESVPIAIEIVNLTKASDGTFKTYYYTRQRPTTLH